MKEFGLYLLGLPILFALLWLLHYFRSLVTMTVFAVVFGTLYFVWYILLDGAPKHNRSYHDE